MKQLSYQEETIESKNPIARFAHRNRLRRSIAFCARVLPPGGSVLDYGCGDGTFVRKIENLGYRAFGYEPYMEGKTFSQIYRDFSDLENMPLQVDMMTVFETIEHLSEDELLELLARSKKVLSPKGKILFSAPIEIGPSLLLKILNRNRRYGRPLFDKVSASTLKAALFGLPEARDEDIKYSHKGYDFRRSIAFVKAQGFDVSVLAYGPLPLPTWYGNSQVYFLAAAG